MTLAERLSSDISRALKAGQTLRLETLRTVLAALKEKAVEKRPGGGLTADDELSVLLQAAKKRREAADIFLQKGRRDIAEQEEAELAVIQEYLPKPIDAAELRSIVGRVIAATSASGPGDFGSVMPAVMKEVRGRVDGRLVQSTVKTMLEELPRGDA